MGYFHRTFVDRLRWIDEAAYARLIALSQFFTWARIEPSRLCHWPAQSGSAWRSMAAFIGFTLPSFILLYLLAAVMQCRLRPLSAV